jgi:hypothetical protein
MSEKKQWLKLPASYFVLFLMFNDLRWGMTVCFVDIGEIADHHYLDFPMITWSENEKIAMKILRY